MAGHPEIIIVYCFRPMSFISSSMAFHGIHTHKSYRLLWESLSLSPACPLSPGPLELMAHHQQTTLIFYLFYGTLTSSCCINGNIVVRWRCYFHYFPVEFDCCSISYIPQGLMGMIALLPPHLCSPILLPSSSFKSFLKCVTISPSCVIFIHWLVLLVSSSLIPSALLLLLL